MNPYSYVCELQTDNQTSAQKAIETALIHLLDKKQLHEISVKELCQKANVARSTFYAYYDDMEACQRSLENRFLYRIVRMNTELTGSGKIDTIDLSFYDDTIKYIQDNQEMLYIVMVKRYSSRFADIWKDAVKYHLYDRIPHKISEKNKELTLEIIAEETIGAYKYWLKNPCELDVEYVKLLIRRTLEVYTEQ